MYLYGKVAISDCRIRTDIQHSGFLRHAGGRHAHRIDTRARQDLMHILRSYIGGRETQTASYTPPVYDRAGERVRTA